MGQSTNFSMLGYLFNFYVKFICPAGSILLGAHPALDPKKFADNWPKMTIYGKHSKHRWEDTDDTTYSEPTAESVIDRVDQVHCSSLPLNSVSDFLH